MRLCVARGGHARNSCLGVWVRAEPGETPWLRMTLSWEVFPAIHFLVCVRMWSQRSMIGLGVVLQTLSWGARRDQVSTSTTPHLTLLLLFHYSLTILYIHMCVCVITLKIYNYQHVECTYAHFAHIYSQYPPFLPYSISVPTKLLSSNSPLYLSLSLFLSPSYLPSFLHAFN